MWNQSAKHNAGKTYICAPEDVLLLIINNIHNLSFLFQVKSCLCKINVVILLHSVDVSLFHHTSPQWMTSRVQLILVYFEWLSLCIIDLHYVDDN